MKIADFSVAMESKHTMTKTYMHSESIKQIGDVPKNVKVQLPNQSLIKKAVSDYLELSKEAMKKSKEDLSYLSKPTDINNIDTTDIPEKDEQQLILLAKMLKALTGKDFKFTVPKNIKINNSNHNIPTKVAEQMAQHHNPVQWAAEYKSSETYSENEALNFKANAVINTSDGKQIDISLELNMSRQFVAQNNIDIRMGNQQLLDPLVINFDAVSADFSKSKFSFDIDSDGTEDQISTLQNGSGFLALDANNDGWINDGNELFGTKSGNGFKDLSNYDLDKNHWIDENDTIFNKLRIWSVEEDGTKTLFSLGEKGIGAIYLGNVSAAFDSTDEANNLLAQSKTAGIFVRENGTAGTLQQVDFVV